MDKLDQQKNESIKWNVNTVDYYIAVNINHMDMYLNNVKV